MSHGKAVWRRLRFFFTGHQPSCQRGPFLGFVLTPCPVLFFSCFSATPQFHSPVIFSGIRFPVSSHQVGPSGEIVGPIHFCFACASLWHQFVSLPGVFRIESSSVSSEDSTLFTRFLVVRFSSDGVSILIFLPSLVLIPSRAQQKSRTPKKAYSRHYDVFEAPLASRFTVHNFSLAVLVACRT